MIAYLRGVLFEKHPNQIIVDVNGVGYDVTIPVSTFTGLPDTGGETKLHIHTHVREDALSLFGFLTREEKVMFEKLLTVSGIGPKLAVTILSGLATADLAASIRQGQLDRLVKIPGVGKKTAERLVVELRDKLDAVTAAAAPSVAGAGSFSPLEQDVISALLNLGSNRAHAEAAVQKAKAAGTPVEFEPLFRRSLEFLR